MLTSGGLPPEDAMTPQVKESRKDAIKGYVKRMRELTESVAKRNEKIHSQNNGNGNGHSQES